MLIYPSIFSISNNQKALVVMNYIQFCSHERYFCNKTQLGTHILKLCDVYSCNEKDTQGYYINRKKTRKENKI